MLDLQFPITSQGSIPSDCAYSLYSALCSEVPALHSMTNIGIHPIAGRVQGHRTTELDHRSFVTIRCDTQVIPELIVLTGARIRLQGNLISLGTPKVRPFGSSSAVRSRLVTIKGYQDADRFQSRAETALRDVTSDAPVLSVGKRRTLNIHGKEVVGFEVIVEGMTAEESLALQESGLGGRRKMGCGVFVPMGGRR